MKKILITGINGFIGCNLYKNLKEKFQVYGIDILGNSSKNIIIGEVSLNNILKFKTKFDCIVHLAGSGTVGMSEKNPQLEYDKSVGSCKIILEYIKNYNKHCRLIYSSSASVYGNEYKDPISELKSKNPISLYGKHKLESEQLCEKYYKEDKLDIKIVRFFSLYGVGCRKQLLWDTLCRLKDLQTCFLECYGTGDEKRDFVNIVDAVDFIKLLITREPNFEIFNCGSGISASVREVIELLALEYGKDVRLNFDNILRVGNPDVLLADTKKAKSIGFKISIDLQEGIKDYVRWFKSL